MKQMKNVILGLFLIAFTVNTVAQKKDAVQTVKFEQTKGEFTQKSVTLKEGTYVFSVTNNNAAPEVGLVLIEAGKDGSDANNHIKEAYVSQMVKHGKTETSQPVTLKKGTYHYFCPFNNTPQYTLEVK